MWCQSVCGRIPILVEGERLRPNLASLLELADHVSMSAKFPQVTRPTLPRTLKIRVPDQGNSPGSRRPCQHPLGPQQSRRPKPHHRTTAAAAQARNCALSSVLRERWSDVARAKRAVVSSAQEWTGAACLGDALIMTARRLPEARWLVCTQVTLPRHCRCVKGRHRVGAESVQRPEHAQEIVD